TSAKAGSQIASTPAITAGTYSGRHPASTALIAIFSTVARPSRGATRPISSSPARPLASTAARTRAAVGGMTGRPSVTPRAYRLSIASPSSVIARNGTTTPRYDVGVRLGLALLVLLSATLPGAAAPRATDIVAVDD